MSVKETNRVVMPDEYTIGGGDPAAGGGAAGGGLNPFSLIDIYNNLFDKGGTNSNVVNYTGGTSQGTVYGNPAGQGRGGLGTSQNTPVPPGTTGTSGPAPPAVNPPGTVVSRWAAAHPFMAKMLATMGIPLTLDIVNKFTDGGSIGGSGGIPDVPGNDQATSTLMEILSLQGKTDPALMNQNLAAIQRGTQMAQDTARSEQARMGLYGSNLMQGLQGAITQGGEDRKTNYLAQETALEEKRKRDDLMLWLQLMVNPALDNKSINAGIRAADRNYDAQRDSALINAGATGLGSWFEHGGFWDKKKPSATTTAQNQANYNTGPGDPTWGPVSY